MESQIQDQVKRDGMYPLKEEEEIALFEAKCEDLTRKVTDVQKERFLHTLRSRCAGRIFDLSECGIGPNSMMILEEILLKYPQYSVLKFSLSSFFLQFICTTSVFSSPRF